MMCWQRAPDNRPSFAKITAAITELQMVGWDDMSEPIEHGKTSTLRLSQSLPYSSPNPGVQANPTGTLTKKDPKPNINPAASHDEYVAVSDSSRTATLWAKPDVPLTFLPRGASKRQQAWEEDGDEIAEQRV